MAPCIDNRVCDIVEEELASTHIAWKSKLHKCPHGAYHTAVLSYGGRTFTNAGLVFEICPAPLECLYHKQPVATELYLETRLHIWVRIASLEPPPNGSKILGGEAIIMRENLADEVQAEGGRSAASTPTSAARSLRRYSHLLSSPASAASQRDAAAPSRSSSRSSMTSTHRGPLGRPHMVKCEVVVYVYVTGRHNPLLIKAEGTPRDESVEFCFHQPAVNNALNIEPGDPHKPVYTLWHQTAQTWTTHPKRHQLLFLAPGERVLYREQYTFLTPNLEHYKALLLPPLDGEDTRPLIPAMALVQPKGERHHGEDSSDGPTASSLDGLIPMPKVEGLASSRLRKRSRSPVAPLPSHSSEASSVKKRSGSPLEVPREQKRKRKLRAFSPTAIDLTLEDQSDTAPSSNPIGGARRMAAGKAKRWGKGKGKGLPSASDLIILSD